MDGRISEGLAQANNCVCCGNHVGHQVLYDDLYDDRYQYPGTFALLKCPHCEQFTTFPSIPEEKLPTLYTNYYPRRLIDLKALTQKTRWKDSLFRRLSRWIEGTDNQGQYYAKPGMNVLDIGCGDGSSLLELRSVGANAWGIEADRNVEKVAQHFGLNIHFGSFYDNPFPGKKFDLIILNQVIEHIPDPERLLILLKDRLAEGGNLVLSFPNANSLYRRLCGRQWINWHIPYHLHHFNRRSFALLCGRAGYDIVFLRTVTPNVWSLLQLRSVIGRLRAESPRKIWGAPSIHMSSIEISTQTKTPRRSRHRAVAAVRILKRAIKIALYSLLACTNRAVDACGVGDSLLFVIRHKAITES